MLSGRLFNRIVFQFCAKISGEVILICFSDEAKAIPAQWCPSKFLFALSLFQSFKYLTKVFFLNPTAFSYVRTLIGNLEHQNKHINENN